LLKDGGISAVDNRRYYKLTLIPIFHILILYLQESRRLQ
jgi:hypothetical protein